MKSSRSKRSAILATSHRKVLNYSRHSTSAMIFSPGPKRHSQFFVKQPEEMKEEGFEGDTVPVYGVPSNPLADFAFAIITNQKVDLRKLLLGLIGRTTRVSISEKTGIREATISDYLRNKRSMTCDNYEKVVNALNNN